MKARNIPPIDLLPSWWLYWKPINPLDPDAQGSFMGIWKPEKLIEMKEKDLGRLRKNWQCDEIDLIMVLLREVTCVYTCYECGHQWEETDEWEKAEFYCPECMHFNSLKYQEQILVDLAPCMDRYHSFTPDQWREYEAAGEGWKPRPLPSLEDLVKRKRPEKPKTEPKKQPIAFEQLELFPI